MNRSFFPAPVLTPNSFILVNDTDLQSPVKFFLQLASLITWPIPSLIQTAIFSYISHPSFHTSYRAELAALLETVSLVSTAAETFNHIAFFTNSKCVIQSALSPKERTEGDTMQMLHKLSREKAGRGPVDPITLSVVCWKTKKLTDLPNVVAGKQSAPCIIQFSQSYNQGSAQESID